MNKDEIAELIKLLRLEAVACRRAGPSDVADKLNKAANALTTLSAENERLERRNASDRECWRLAAENCAALSARVETLEAQVQAASKAEMDRLRYITGDQLAFAEERLLRHDADFKIPPRKDAVRYCTALADALESHHD